MKERTFYETIGYPYTALVTTTFRMTLLGRKAIPPLVIALIPLAPVLIMRILYFLFASRHEFHIGDPFEIYSGICAVMHLQFVVPMMALMRGMTIFSEEKKERTITYLFLRPVPRSVLAAGKYTGSLLSLIVLLSFSLVSVFGILGTFPNTDMITGDFGVLLKDIAVLSLGLAAYAAVLMVVGTFFKHSLLISIFLVFMWDSAAAYIPGFAHRLTLKFYVQCLFPHEGERDLVSDLLTAHTPVSPFNCVLILGLVILGSLALTTLILKTKEFAGEGQEND